MTQELQHEHRGIEHRFVQPDPAVKFSVRDEVEALHNSDDWRSGISRKLLLRYADFRLTLIAIKAGKRIEEHHNPGRISVHTVAGHISMRALGRSFDLPLGHVLVLDRAVVHDVEAVGEDSAFLLTVAHPEQS